MINISKKKEDVSLSIDHSEDGFFSDGFTITHGPSKFIIDFTQSVPKFDMVEGTMRRTVNIKHKTVILDPEMAKSLVGSFSKNMKRFENKFRKIKLNTKVKKNPSVKKIKKRLASKSNTSYIG